MRDEASYKSRVVMPYRMKRIQELTRKRRRGRIALPVEVKIIDRQLILI